MSRVLLLVVVLALASGCRSKDPEVWAIQCDYETNAATNGVLLRWRERRGDLWTSRAIQINPWVCQSDARALHAIRQLWAIEAGASP